MNSRTRYQTSEPNKKGGSQMRGKEVLGFGGGKKEKKNVTQRGKKSETKINRKKKKEKEKRNGHSESNDERLVAIKNVIG